MPERNCDASGDVLVAVASAADIVAARRLGRELAERLGFAAVDATLVATAISELARNIVKYAGHGDIVLRPIEDGTRRGIVVVARDRGPGIDDVKRAMQPGFSTSGGLGLGLPGVRRIVDDFEVVSGRDLGTTVTITKWST